MATSGTNYTAKWKLNNGILTISPVSGSSGIMRTEQTLSPWYLDNFISLTDSESESVTSIVFVGSIRLQSKGFMTSSYNNITDFGSLFHYGGMFSQKKYPLEYVDISGLNTYGAKSLSGMFSLPYLTQIDGIGNIDTSQVTDFSVMFAESGLSTIDISSFSANAINNADTIQNMFRGVNYCSMIILPSGFQRAYASGSNEDPRYNFGIATIEQAATKSGVTIASDLDFFKLTAATQGGTWVRDISGTAELSFRVSNITRDGNVAEMSYIYYSDSATVEVYLKTTDQSSFPSTPSTSFSIEGTGTSTVSLNLSSDSAYDVMVKVTDGTTTIYTYPSIDSNVCLFSIDESGEQSNYINSTDADDTAIDTALTTLGWTACKSGAMLLYKKTLRRVLEKLINLTNRDTVKVVNATIGSFSVPANQYKAGTGTFTVPSGYKAVGIVGCTVSASGALPISQSFSGTTATLGCRNITSSAVTQSGTIKIACIPTN